MVVKINENGGQAQVKLALAAGLAETQFWFSVKCSVFEYCVKAVETQLSFNGKMSEVVNQKQGCMLHLGLTQQSQVCSEQG